MSAVPFELDTMMELGEKYVEPVPPFAIVFVKDPLPTQVPFTAKHPLVILNPFIPVEEAVVNSPPFTDNSSEGEVVPIPR
jgi:hypothetical protein